MFLLEAGTACLMGDDVGVLHSQQEFHRDCSAKGVGEVLYRASVLGNAGWAYEPSQSKEVDQMGVSQF